MPLSNSLFDKVRPRISNPQQTLSVLTQRHQLAANALSTYYMFSVYVSYSLLDPIHTNSLSGKGVYLWPVSWLDYFDGNSAPQIISIICFVAALVCTLAPGARIWRIVFAVSALMTAALANSYGAINHGYHIWVWLAAIFATAPTNLSQLASRRDKLGLLATITGAQLFVLLTYSLAGLHKFKGGIAAMLQGDAGNFSLTGPAAQIADRILQTETEPFAAAFVISHTGLFAPLFWGLIFCQLLALVVVFFPRLHRSFGLVLIGFHFGTWALMEISFPLHVIWLLIFFVMSPFRPLDNSDSPLAILRDFFRWGRNIFAAPRLGIGQKQAIRRPAA